MTHHLTDQARLRAIAERAFADRQAEDVWRSKLDGAIALVAIIATVILAMAAIN